MSWITNNWDKIIGVFLLIIVAGLIGFFSAIISLRGEINDLRIQITELKVELEKVVTPKLLVLDSHAQKISTLEKNVVVISTNTDQLRAHTENISRQTDAILILQWQKGAHISKP